MGQVFPPNLAKKDSWRGGGWEDNIIERNRERERESLENI